MKTCRYIVEIKMPDGDMVSANWLKDIIQHDCDSEDKERQKVSVRELDLSEGLDEAAVEYQIKTYGSRVVAGSNILSDDEFKQWNTNNDFRAGAEWMAGQGWHDITETPSIFGFYLVIHEKGWCVANYMGKGVVCESGWVEAIHHIEIEHPQKWLDLRDLIPKETVTIGRGGYRNGDTAYTSPIPHSSLVAAPFLTHYRRIVT